MQLNLLKTLRKAAVAGVSMTALCIGLLSEAGELDPRLRITPKRAGEGVVWGVTVPDFIKRLNDIHINGPRYARNLVKLLKPVCPQRLQDQLSLQDPGFELGRACGFIPLYRDYLIIDQKLKQLVDAKVFKLSSELGEISFRGLNWELDPFAEINGQDAQADAIKTLVDWMIARRALHAKLFDVEVYASLAHSKWTTVWFVPLIRAHFASPLYVGQVASFIRDQECASVACRNANRQLEEWLIDHLQEWRQKTVILKGLFDRAAEGIPSEELVQLTTLFNHDRSFQKNPEALTASYLRFLDKAGLQISSNTGDLAKAKLGVIVTSEILAAFSGAVPAQNPLESDIFHKDIVEMENRIRAEIDAPISSLLKIADKFTEGI